MSDDLERRVLHHWRDRNDTGGGCDTDNQDFHDVESSLLVADGLYRLAALIGDGDDTAYGGFRLVVYLCDYLAPDFVPLHDGTLDLFGG